jgi:hypothetical protein
MYTPRRVLLAMRWLLFGTPSQRRRVRQELARISASIFGDFFISDDYKLWLEDKEFRQKYKELSPGNPYSMDRKYTLREFARLVREVPGAIAECGCYEGATAWFMASVLPDVPLYLFDSFSGLSNPSREDTALSENHFAWQAGDLSSSEEKVADTLAEFGNVTIYKGWIPERFNEVDGQSFRLVHIDVDLYEPTKDSIEFFYPRMSAGGVMIFDDYGTTSCPGAYKAVEEYMRDREEYILHLPTGQGVVIKA